MRVDITTLKAVIEDIETAMETMRGFAAIAECRVVLDLEAEGLRLVVIVPSAHSDPEVEILPLPEKEAKKA